jgi:hypothetical protein
MNKTTTLPEKTLFKKIHLIRDQKVLFDFDLASLYGVETRVLKQAVKRNAERFPEDFMLELSPEEWKSLRSQFVILKSGRGQHSKYPPMAFTEQGVAMLSSVLNSPRAIAINIQIMRVFVKMRQMIISYKDLLEKIEKLEASDLEQNKHIRNIYNLIKELLEPAVKKQRPIGFRIKSTKD